MGLCWGFFEEGGVVSEFSCCRRWVILLQFCLSDSVCFLRVLFFAVALWTRSMLCVSFAWFLRLSF